MIDQSQQIQQKEHMSDISRWTAWRSVNSQFCITRHILFPEMFPARHRAASIIHALFLCLTSVNKATLPRFEQLRQRRKRLPSSAKCSSLPSLPPLSLSQRSRAELQNNNPQKTWCFTLFYSQNAPWLSRPYLCATGLSVTSCYQGLWMVYMIDKNINMLT